MPGLLRRSLTLIVAGALVLVLAVASVLLPVPYIVLQPGPTENVIGGGGEPPLITVDGHEVPATEGELRMVTISYTGGPGSPLDLFTALSAWIEPDRAVVPQETLFPPDQSADDVDQANQQMMVDSQTVATAAALRQLEMPVEAAVAVGGVQEGMPADGELEIGDVITEVDGEPVDSPEEAAGLIRDREPGSEVVIDVDRQGEPTEVELTTEAAEGDPEQSVVGVVVQASYDFPVEVDITVEDIGGPSAGLIFALSLVDIIGGEDLTGGHHVAGTGTITVDGEVGPVGGVPQKLVGAARDGATVFLIPAGNCDAAADAPEGLDVVRVDTLDGAIQALETLRTGEGELPRCP
ncbi:YlbL family protein [Allonocardiopsis opalescens]|uniref:endopeptidase La n=1 Tax=Allonocardiopsis opalescens TaxID=1144618 RepID=A0A2T0QDR0_9ACTN|nr:PDZ domain-containing protein [Allonocardiopsis opalescens]PRY02032.1 PDZ domain-containing protein [Allonocardiopsis opalescens]